MFSDQEKRTRKSDTDYRHSASALDRAFLRSDNELDSFLKDGIAIGKDESNPWYNEILEAYLIHARVLISFLGGGELNPRATDITPGDFGVVWKWPTSPEAEEITRQYTLINKHLAHLAWERTEGGWGESVAILGVH